MATEQIGELAYDPTTNKVRPIAPGDRWRYDPHVLTARRIMTPQEAAEHDAKIAQSRSGGSASLGLVLAAGGAGGYLVSRSTRGAVVGVALAALLVTVGMQRFANR